MNGLGALPTMGVDDDLWFKWLLEIDQSTRAAWLSYKTMDLVNSYLKERKSGSESDAVLHGMYAEVLQRLEGYPGGRAALEIQQLQTTEEGVPAASSDINDANGTFSTPDDHSQPAVSNIAVSASNELAASVVPRNFSNTESASPISYEPSGQANADASAPVTESTNSVPVRSLSSENEQSSFDLMKRAQESTDDNGNSDECDDESVSSDNDDKTPPDCVDAAPSNGQVQPKDDTQGGSDAMTADTDENTPNLVRESTPQTPPLPPQANVQQASDKVQSPLLCIESENDAESQAGSESEDHEGVQLAILPDSRPLKKQGQGRNKTKKRRPDGIDSTFFGRRGRKRAKKSARVKNSVIVPSGAPMDVDDVRNVDAADTDDETGPERDPFIAMQSYMCADDDGDDDGGASGPVFIASRQEMMSVWPGPHFDITRMLSCNPVLVAAGLAAVTESEDVAAWKHNALPCQFSSLHLTVPLPLVTRNQGSSKYVFTLDGTSETTDVVFQVDGTFIRRKAFVDRQVYLGLLCNHDNVHPRLLATVVTTARSSEDNLFAEVQLSLQVPSVTTVAVAVPPNILCSILEP